MGQDALVIVKGAGDLASGVIARLHRAGFAVVATELEQPTTVRRTVAFSEAVYAGEVTIEDVRARRLTNLEEIQQAWNDGVVPVLVDPHWAVVQALRPAVLVDAIMAKRNLGTHLSDASVVIGLGPGFTAGIDVHAVVETNRGHDLGRVLWQGAAEPDTGVPGLIDGHSVHRILRAPVAGVLRDGKAIGDHVEAGEAVCSVEGVPVKANLSVFPRTITPGPACVPGNEDRRYRPACHTYALLYYLRQIAGYRGRCAGSGFV